MDSLTKTKYINWSQAYALIKDIQILISITLKNNADKSGIVNIVLQTALIFIGNAK